MGACYSKGSASAKHFKLKAPKSKKYDSKNTGEPFIDSEQSRNDDIEQNHAAVEDNVIGQGDSNPLLPQTPVFPDLVSDLDDGRVEQMTTSRASIGDKGVAPSDSGIESIGLVAAEECVLVEESSTNLSTKIERLSRGSCHKCGNFKLDDNALTALLSNTYCLCGPRQAGKPSVNPDCQTHGVKRDFKRSQSMPAQCGIVHIENFCASSSSSPLKSNLKRRKDGERKEKTLRISLENNLNSEINHVDNLEDEWTLLRENTSNDALDKDSKEQKRQSRRSLLSEILDITDSICKCDFYSNEYCVGQDNSGGINGKDCNNDVENVDDTLESLALSGSTTASNCDISNETFTEEAFSKKSHSVSLSKFVTFAQEKEVKAGSGNSGKNGSHSCPISPLKRLHHQTEFHTSVSDTSSGVDMQSGDASGGTLLSRDQKSEHEHLMTTPSYEAVDRTEDDMASIDMDSLSRVTSLSYSSIRHLLESTEDLVEPLDSVRRMTINGEDCVIIPTNTYKQMQSDLTTLKEQLVCLSSLLQEVCAESAGRDTEPKRKSLSFYTDQNATPTQRRILFRSQEFVDMVLQDQ